MHGANNNSNISVSNLNVSKQRPASSEGERSFCVKLSTKMGLQLGEGIATFAPVAEKSATLIHHNFLAALVPSIVDKGVRSFLRVKKILYITI